jgi:hypothetical protein
LVALAAAGEQGGKGERSCQASHLGVNGRPTRKSAPKKA